ncbi:MAG: ATP-binding protein [Spirochaetes bacterium]|nr:ATP-binding protein [Spirochaetota bacterium]
MMTEQIKSNLIFHAKQNYLQIMIPADIQYLTILVKIIHRFLFLYNSDEQFLVRVKLAVDEIVTNIIEHGCQNSDDKQINIMCTVEGDTIIIQIKDNTKFFNPLDQNLPSLEQLKKTRSKRGWGIYLTKMIISEMEHSYNEGNILTMRIFKAP